MRSKTGYYLKKQPKAISLNAVYSSVDKSLLPDTYQHLPEE